MIRFRYQPSLEDYSKLNRYFLWKHLRRLVMLSCVLFAVFLVLPLLVVSNGQEPEKTMGEVYLSGLTLLILPGIVCFIYITTHFTVRKRWSAVEEIRIDKEYEIDDTGVRVIGSSLSGFLEWRHFTCIELQKGYYFLKTAQNQFHYFPASIVPDVQLLNSLLATKIPVAKQAKPLARFRKAIIIWVIIVSGILILYFLNPTP